jgi:hypothetical protein
MSPRGRSPVVSSWRLFQPSDAKINLRLAETRTFGNGVVLLRYQPLTHKAGKSAMPGL